MMAGLLGLYIEFTHPGVVLPGVAGGICLLLAPDRDAGPAVNYGGLALLVPRRGAARRRGVPADVRRASGVGRPGRVPARLALPVRRRAERTSQVARSLVAGAGGGARRLHRCCVGTLVVRRAAAAGARSACEGMIGAVGTARERLAPAGIVLVRGEYWTADERGADRGGHAGRGRRGRGPAAARATPRRAGRARRAMEESHAG